MKIGQNVVERLRFLVQEKKHELSNEIVNEIMFIVSLSERENKKQSITKSTLKWIGRAGAWLIQELL